MTTAKEINTALGALDGRRETIDAEMRQIHERCGDRALNDGEQERWSRLQSGLDKILVERRDLVGRLAGIPGHIESTDPGDYDRDPMRDGRDVFRPRHQRSNPWRGVYEHGSVAGIDIRGRTDMQSRAADIHFRALDAVECASGMSDAGRKAATAKLEAIRSDPRGDAAVAEYVVTTSDPDYVAGFQRYLAGQLDLCSPEERAALRRGQDLKRALAIGADSTGGFLSPVIVDPALILDDNGAVSPVRQLATVKTVTTKTTRFLLTTAVTGSWDGEAAEVSDDSPTLSSKDLVAHKRQAFIPLSIETLAATLGNITQELSVLFADDRNTAEATAFVTGSGTNQPKGFVTGIGAAELIASNTTDVFALSDVYDLDEELSTSTRHHARSQWLANYKIYQAIREAGGDMLDDFWANLSQGKPSQLLGHPAHVASTMDGVIDAAADNKVLALADWKSFYGIADIAGLSIELIPHLFATGNNRPSGQRGFYAWSMVGGDVLVSRAGRLLNVT